MVEPSALFALVRQAEIKYSLGCRIIYRPSFRHGGDPNDPCQFINISDFYNNRGSRRSLDIGVWQLYFKYFSYVAGHDGQSFCGTKVIMQVKELNLDRVREKRFSSLNI